MSLTPSHHSVSLPSPLTPPERLPAVCVLIYPTSSLNRSAPLAGPAWDIYYWVPEPTLVTGTASLCFFKICGARLLNHLGSLSDAEPCLSWHLPCWRGLLSTHYNVWSSCSFRGVGEPVIEEGKPKSELRAWVKLISDGQAPSTRSSFLFEHMDILYVTVSQSYSENICLASVPQRCKKPASLRSTRPPHDHIRSCPAVTNLFEFLSKTWKQKSLKGSS